MMNSILKKMIFALAFIINICFTHAQYGNSQRYESVAEIVANKVFLDDREGYKFLFRGRYLTVSYNNDSNTEIFNLYNADKGELQYKSTNSNGVASVSANWNHDGYGNIYYETPVSINVNSNDIWYNGYVQLPEKTMSLEEVRKKEEDERQELKRRERILNTHDLFLEEINMALVDSVKKREILMPFLIWSGNANPYTFEEIKNADDFIKFYNETRGTNYLRESSTEYGLSSTKFNDALRYISRYDLVTQYEEMSKKVILNSEGFVENSVIKVDGKFVLEEEKTSPIVDKFIQRSPKSLVDNPNLQESLRYSKYRGEFGAYCASAALGRQISVQEYLRYEDYFAQKALEAMQFNRIKFNRPVSRIYINELIQLLITKGVKPELAENINYRSEIGSAFAGYYAGREPNVLLTKEEYIEKEAATWAQAFIRAINQEYVIFENGEPKVNQEKVRVDQKIVQNKYAKKQDSVIKKRPDRVALLIQLLINKGVKPELAENINYRSEIGSAFARYYAGRGPNFLLTKEEYIRLEAVMWAAIFAKGIETEKIIFENGEPKVNEEKLK